LLKIRQKRRFGFLPKTPGFDQQLNSATVAPKSRDGPDKGIGRKGQMPYRLHSELRTGQLSCSIDPKPVSKCSFIQRMRLLKAHGEKQGEFGMLKTVTKPARVAVGGHTEFHRCQLKDYAEDQVAKAVMDFLGLIREGQPARSRKTETGSSCPDSCDACVTGSIFSS
jgi:hypothetical protein